MSGQIAADVALREGGDVHVRTMSGDVTLRLPAGSDAQVRLQSTSGRGQQRVRNTPDRQGTRLTYRKR